MALSQAGFVVKLGDTAVWGLLPVFFTAPSQGLSMATVGIITAAYPASWAILQPFTGAASDRFGRHVPIMTGMFLQACSCKASVSSSSSLPASSGAGSGA